MVIKKAPNYTQLDNEAKKDDKRRQLGMMEMQGNVLMITP